MDERLPESVSRAGRTRNAAALALLACLLVAGCAQRDDSSQKNQPGGFYGGVSGGKGI